MLYQRRRPKELKAVMGNEETKEALRTMLNRPADEIPPALLFEGPSGCGKTTLARIVAKEMDAEFIEVDSADFSGVDFIRDLRRRMQRVSLQGKAKKAWLLDECHMLSNAAQNALLKGLEDPPGHCMIMLATTNPEKLIPTIRNRCSRFGVNLLNHGDSFKLVRRVVKEEKKEMEKEVMLKIADVGGGSPRALLTALDKVIDLSPDKQMATVTRMERAEEEAVNLCKALINPRADWAATARILGRLKETEDAEGVRRMVLGYAAAVLMKPKDDPNCYIMLDAFREPFYHIGWPGVVLASYEVKKGTA